MLLLHLKGILNSFAGKCRQLFAILTNDEFLYYKGKEIQLLGGLQSHLGKDGFDFRKFAHKTDAKSGEKWRWSRVNVQAEAEYSPRK